MPNFEAIIRPFQSPNVAPAKRVITQNEKSSPLVWLQIGRGGSPKTMSASHSVTQTYYMTKAVAEKAYQIGPGWKFP